MTKPKCKKCKKDFKFIVSIFLNSNEYEFYCIKHFNELILKNPFYLNNTLTIRYYEYCN